MKKQQVFYIHGGSAFSRYEDFLESLRTATIRDLPGNPEKVLWNRSLREDLGEEFEVFMPTMPNKHNAKYAEWKIWFERHFELLRDGVILVGWSLGGMFLTKYLAENEVPFNIGAVLLIAAPFGPFVGEKEDCVEFGVDQELIEKLTEKAGRVVIMHSKDDFVVPYEHALRYKEVLPEAELMTFEDKNHFLIEEFPELLDKIREVKLARADFCGIRSTG